MTESPESTRRHVLASAAAAGLIATLGGFDAPSFAAAVAHATGKAGDFNFLAGEWRISHRRLKEKDDWDVFEGEATCWSLLDGIASIEELRIPARNFSGMGIRLLDVEKHVWSDYWINSRSGQLSTPGMTGVFVNGVGTFTADDVDGNRPIKVRGVWDRITQSSCRWHQATSKDNGATWQADWFMDWKRVRPRTT